MLKEEDEKEEKEKEKEKEEKEEEEKEEKQGNFLRAAWETQRCLSKFKEP